MTSPLPGSITCSPFVHGVRIGEERLQVGARSPLRPVASAWRTRRLLLSSELAVVRWTVTVRRAARFEADHAGPLGVGRETGRHVGEPEEGSVAY